MKYKNILELREDLRHSLPILNYPVNVSYPGTDSAFLHMASKIAVVEVPRFYNLVERKRWSEYPWSKPFT